MASLLILGSSGCNPSNHPVSSEQKPQTPSVSAKDYPKLASVLFQLTQANDPEQFAAQHPDALQYEQGRVLVTVELQSGQTALPSGYNFEITSQFQNRFDVLVPVSELLRLAQEPQVRSIRLPLKPVPHS
jgi:hypothetical protein